MRHTIQTIFLFNFWKFWGAVADSFSGSGQKGRLRLHNTDAKLVNKIDLKKLPHTGNFRKQTKTNHKNISIPLP